MDLETIEWIYDLQNVSMTYKMDLEATELI